MCAARLPDTVRLQLTGRAAISDRLAGRTPDRPFGLTFAVFIGVYVATKLESRAGAADGKLMVGLAAFAPLALGIGILLEVAVFAMLRLRGEREAAISGAFWLYLGLVITVCFVIVGQVTGVLS